MKLDQATERLADLVARLESTAPTNGPEPLLWNLKTAQARTGLPRDRGIFNAFHAGAIQGLWSGEVRGNGSILLKPDSVRAWIDSQIQEQAPPAPSV